MTECVEKSRIATGKIQAAGNKRTEHSTWSKRHLPPQMAAAERDLRPPSCTRAKRTPLAAADKIRDPLIWVVVTTIIS